MTEGERVLYKRYLREELRLASAAVLQHQREHHRLWAKYYEELLDGVSKSRASSPPRQLLLAA